MLEHSPFAKKINISKQVQHDTVVALSLKNLEELSYIDNRFVTFTINQTNVPFVLPTCDIIEYAYGPYNCISLAVTPKILVTLIDNEHKCDFTRDNNRICRIIINDTNDILIFNESAFENQKKLGCGYVVSSDLTLLKDLQIRFEMNNQSTPF